ncbi:MAG: hypothetical protein LBH44_01950 [Treponema sp.]|jgi:hypothetical protein|nr:hypothetical protein [Treponema sp.]
MLFYNEERILEGIDSIELKFEDYLIGAINICKKIDPKNKISINNNYAHFRLSDGTPAGKWHLYLHITGEYINPQISLKMTIAMAVQQLIMLNILSIIHPKTGTVLSEMPIDVIYHNLDLFFSGVSTIEFCFDFKREDISIANDAKIIDNSNIEFVNHLNTKLKDRPKCLIKEGKTTFYSYDYKRDTKRKSTLKLYDREKWLLKKNNEYSSKIIRDNPYKMRIEFVLKRNKNTSYLSLKNLEGNYYQIIERFIPYLSKLYRKYFSELVLVSSKVSSDDYPFFSAIYIHALYDALKANKTLENINKAKKGNRQSEMNRKFLKLLKLLEIENKKREKLLKDIPLSYYAGFADIKNLSEEHYVTPYDLQNEENILYKDEEYTFLKTPKYLQLPKFRTIENDDETPN